MREIIKCFHNQEIHTLDRTNYVVNPLLDHHPETTFSLLQDAVHELSKLINFENTVKIVCEEDRGGFIGSIIAYEHKKSLAMVKWNPVGLNGHHKVEFRNAYTTGEMFLYGVKEDENVTLVEDLIDSGGTIIAMIELLKKANVNIVDVVCLADKVETNGRKKIKEKTGIEVKSLMRFTAVGVRSAVVEVLGEPFSEENLENYE